MGYASRSNPVSLDAAPDERDVKIARMKRFVEQFETREAFEAFLALNTETLSDGEREFLEGLYAEVVQ